MPDYSTPVNISTAVERSPIDNLNHRIEEMHKRVRETTAALLDASNRVFGARPEEVPNEKLAKVPSCTADLLVDLGSDIDKLNSVVRRFTN